MRRHVAGRAERCQSGDIRLHRPGTVVSPADRVPGWLWHRARHVTRSARDASRDCGAGGISARAVTSGVGSVGLGGCLRDASARLPANQSARGRKGRRCCREATVWLGRGAASSHTVQGRWQGRDRRARVIKTSEEGKVQRHVTAARDREDRGMEFSEWGLLVLG